MKRRWVFPKVEDAEQVREVAQGLNLPLPIASLLVSRGFISLEEASCFLDPRLAHLQPPEEIPGIADAIERIHTAIEKKQHIVLYGDYDVDGTTSLAFLSRFLKAIGAASLNCFIPERAREGYGLTLAGIDRCLSLLQPDLIIAADCGTNSHQEAQFLSEQGIDLIIVDHHEIQRKEQGEDEKEKTSVRQSGALPILVNPQLGKNYHYLCTVGLIFKLCHAFLKKFPHKEVDLREYLDLVALGTVADIVPLIEENRIFVRHGLRQLAHSKWPGIKALIKVADIKPPFTSFDIGYKLGPRINAAGRLSSAQEALELLLTDSSTEADQKARHLDAQNRERQAIERSVTEEAEEWIAQNFNPEEQKSIVLGRSHWHPGVVGIVASRISKRCYRPTLIIGFDQDGLGKGSGRSITGLSLVEALSHCSHLLEAFGGHAMAAGLTLKEENLEQLQDVFEKATGSLIQEEDLIPQLMIDGDVNLSQVDWGWLAKQECLAPFGTANPQPLYMARSVRPLKEPRVLKEKHLRLEFAGANRSSLSAIFFNGAIDPLPEEPWDLAFTLERNSYQGRESLQLQVVALRAAEGGS